MIHEALLAVISMVDQVLESVVIGVASSLLGAAVGAVFGYYLSEKAARGRDRKHLVESQYRAALTVGPELFILEQRMSRVPNSANLITDPDQQLPDFDYPLTTGFGNLILAVNDLPPGLREKVMEKLASVNELLFAYRTTKIWVMKKRIRNLQESDGKREWSTEDTSSAELTGLFNELLKAREEFLSGLDEINHSMGKITERRFIE